MPDRGITLIEVLVVLGTGTLLLSAGGLANTQQISTIGMRQDHEALTDMLLLARFRAQAGLVGGETGSVGVYIDINEIISFQGDSYIGRVPRSDFSVPRMAPDAAADSREFVFLRGDGRAPRESSMRFGTDPGSSIVVSETGTITSL